MPRRQPILMPKLGLTMTEGVLAEWKVAPGDRVKAGDTIFIVETDKISNEIDAAEDGLVEALHASPGDIVPVGEAVATFLGETEAEAPSPAIIAAASGPTPRQASEGQDRLIVTPLARRMAADAGLEISSIAGSGPGGRIMADDVAAAIKSADEPPAPAASTTNRGEILPLGKYQKVAARRLTEAKRDIPHFYIFAEADVTVLLDVRAGLNADPTGIKLTVTHFIVAAIARALMAMPEINRVWTDDGLLQLPSIDVGLAVEGPKGLVAPVLHDLGDGSVEDVAQAANAIAERARSGRLSQDQLEGGAISVSNVGMLGATGLLPIINPGQSSILGVGRSQAVFRPDKHEQPQLRQVMNLALSCDHRVIDGAVAARFLQTIQNSLEAPLPLLRRPKRGPLE